MLKSLTRTVAGSFFLSIILAAMMGLLVVTLRWSHQGRAELKSRLPKGKPEIIIFWHDRQRLGQIIKRIKRKQN